jgi:hypothetical protein
MINRVGIALEPGFILFDAHTTSSELKENLDFLRQTGLYRTPIPTYLVNRLSVYPGTEVEQLLVADGTIAPSPIRLGGKTKNDPGLIVQYFQRMEYVCRDVRSEIAWRSLREALEPVEVFLESSLPALTAVLMDCRAQTDDQQIRNKVRSLIHNAANWRRRVGELVLRFIARCVDSYEICGHPAQWRWLRSKLAEDRNAFAQETLGVSMQAFQENIARLRRGLVLADVSVIIPTAGKWSRLSRTLASLARQRINPDLRWDVIVVADGVTPPSDLNLWTDHLPLRIVQLPGPHGRGATRNAGIAHSRAEVIVLLDDDIVVSPDFVQQHWDAQCRQASLCHGPIRELTGLAYFEDLDELAFSPGMGPHTSPERMKSWATRVLSQLEDTELCWENFGTPSRLERDGVEALYERRMAAAWVGFAGANISAPRKWFLEDGFDESTGTRWGLEDISLALRWTLAGKPLTVAAGARGLHLSHRRGDWKRDHQANAACLSFLPKETVPSVFDYLEGRIEIRDLENSLQSSFHSGTRPSASPFQAAQMEVAVDVNVS